LALSQQTQVGSAEEGMPILELFDQGIIFLQLLIQYDARQLVILQYSSKQHLTDNTTLQT
jgi:hypothetical protein